MRRAPTVSDSYFVRLGTEPAPTTPSTRRGRARTDEGGSSTARSRRRRRFRMSGGTLFVLLLGTGVGSWALWASQRPGGISGTIDGWVSNVRGDVARVSSDPDLSKARRYFGEQYRRKGVYPHLNEADLSGVGIGVGVNVEWCGPQAVVIQGASGGGTSSRLLLSGKDLGELPAKYDCPANLAVPAPWKRA